MGCAVPRRDTPKGPTSRAIPRSAGRCCSEAASATRRRFPGALRDGPRQVDLVAREDRQVLGHHAQINRRQADETPAETRVPRLGERQHELVLGPLHRVRQRGAVDGIAPLLGLTQGPDGRGPVVAGVESVPMVCRAVDGLASESPLYKASPRATQRSQQLAQLRARSNRRRVAGRPSHGPLHARRIEARACQRRQAVGCDQGARSDRRCGKKSSISDGTTAETLS